MLVKDQTPLLECRNLCVTFDSRRGALPILSDFNLTVDAGDTLGIVGESGCGKTTVALAIMRYLGRNGRVTSGQILLNGRDLIGCDDAELRRIRGSKIAMVYQEPMSSLNPSMRIGDQLAEVMICHEDMSIGEARARALEMLRAVHVADPARIMAAYPHQISGGQQQRAVIAMALLANPDLLIMDEPTTALDVTVEAGIVDLIGEISATFGTSIIFISHNLGLVQKVCERVAVMYAGEIVEQGAVDEVFARMHHPYTRALCAAIPSAHANKETQPLIPIRGHLPSLRDIGHGCKFASRCDFYEATACDQNQIPLKSLQGKQGHKVRCVRDTQIDWLSNISEKKPHGKIEPGEMVLKAIDLKKHFPIAENTFGALIRGGRLRLIKANEDVSFVAREGETVAIVGESGCGKSTFAKVLLGLERATSGQILMQGEDIGRVAIQDRSSLTIRNLQMVFQNSFDTLNPSYSIGSQIARVIRKFGIEREPQKIEARVHQLLDAVKLPREFANRLPRQLSGGQKQRIGIVRAFAGHPALVIADEPTSALDVSVQASIINVLMAIQREHRTTLIYISHDLAVVRYIADRVVVMYLGHIVEQGTADQVFAPPFHPYTEALMSAVSSFGDDDRESRIVLDGDLPSAIDPPTGCPFQTRCPRKIGPICEQEMPPERSLAHGHVMRCHIDDADSDDLEPGISGRAI